MTLGHPGVSFVSVIDGTEAEPNADKPQPNTNHR